MVPIFAIASTVAECRDQGRRLSESGVHQASIMPHTQNPADRLATIRTFADEIKMDYEGLDEYTWLLNRRCQSRNGRW